MANPLTKLLGLALRSLRASHLSSKDVADLLAVHDSKYRLIEAGGQIMPLEFILPLIEIPCFSGLKADRLSLYITYCYFLQDSTIRSKPKTKKREIKPDTAGVFKQKLGMLIAADKELVSILTADVINQSKPQANEVINLVNFLKTDYLTPKEAREIPNLSALLELIEDESLCVFNPLIKTSIESLKNEIEALAKISTINDKIKDLEKKIKGIKDLQLGFNIDNAPNFIKVHKYREIKGVIKNPDNLLDEPIIKDYASYMSQVWSDSFTGNIQFLLLSDNKDSTAIDEIIKKYKNQIMLKYVYQAQGIGKEKDELYAKGINKIIFKIIDTNNETVRKLLDGNEEYWFYNALTDDINETNRYGTQYGFFTYASKVKDDKKKPTEVIQYRILTNKEVKKANENFNNAWNIAIPGPL